MKTKGGPRKKRKTNKCSNCKNMGHNIRSCPKVIGHCKGTECVSSSESEDDVPDSCGFQGVEVSVLKIIWN